MSIRKIISLFVLLLAFGGEALAASQEIEPAVSFQKIIVYPDSAMIRKQAVFPLKKGDNIIKISGIASDMVDASIQTSIKDDREVRIDDVKIEKTFLTKVNREKSDKLKNRLEDLDAHIKSGTNEIVVLNSSADFLKKVMPFPQNAKTTSSEVDAYVRYFSSSMSDIYKKIANSEQKLRMLEEEKKALEKELKDLNSPDESKTIVLSAFSQHHSKQVTLLFSYLVSRAGWFPQYNLRADSHAKVVLDCFATVKQATGEDWKGVLMEISTAKPSIYGEAPVLSPWLIDIYSPRPIRAKSALRRDFNDAESMFMEKTNEEPSMRGYEPPQIQPEATSFSFIMPRKVDVPSDNQPHKILISSAGQDAVFNYYAVPKLSKYSYLRADLKSPFQFPLLQGPLSIFLDGRLVGTSSLGKTVLPNEEIRISLGVDEGIKVEKKLIKKYTEYTGAFTKETRVHYEYAIEVSNGKDNEITLTVSDNVPVSSNEQIKVELVSPKKNQARIGEDGIISWDLKPARGEKKNLSVKFDVIYPQNVTVTGLE